MRLATITLVLSLLLGCGGSTPDRTTFTFDFGEGVQGWTTGFANYPAGEEQFYELDSGLRSLPPPLNQSSTGILLSGVNHSDALFMFLKGRLTGLKPDQNYAFQFLVEFASNAPSGCVGVGGAPGEAVVVLAGASPIEPEAVIVGGDYKMNIDEGVVVGNVANGLTDCDNPVYVMKTVPTTPVAFTATTDSQGTIWTTVGTRSGFEGRTAVYYTKVVVTVQPS